MGFLRNRLARRFPRLGLLSDLALIGGAASTLMQRRNGGPRVGAASAMSTAEMALAAGAAVRLVQRLMGRRRAKRPDVD